MSFYPPHRPPRIPLQYASHFFLMGLLYHYAPKIAHSHMDEKIGKPASVALPIIIGSMCSLLCLYAQSRCNYKKHPPSQNHENTETTTDQNKNQDRAWSLLPLIYCAVLSGTELIEIVHGKETATTTLISYLCISLYAIVPTLITGSNYCSGLAKRLDSAGQQLFNHRYKQGAGADLDATCSLLNSAPTQ